MPCHAIQCIQVLREVGQQHGMNLIKPQQRNFDTALWSSNEAAKGSWDRSLVTSLVFFFQQHMNPGCVRFQGPHVMAKTKNTILAGWWWNTSNVMLQTLTRNSISSPIYNQKNPENSLFFLTSCGSCSNKHSPRFFRALVRLVCA